MNYTINGNEVTFENGVKMTVSDFVAEKRQEIINLQAYIVKVQQQIADDQAIITQLDPPVQAVSS